MMNGRGESDSAIVAGKPTNKAERSAAEPAEPRAEAKGNAGQQSTRRAQNRVSVSQALERIRQTARQRKKEKFTALFHHVSIDHLEEAFLELKENAAPGVDGLTCRDYEQHLEHNLEDLHARVHRGAYRALPSRRVYIPKPDGRQRPIAVAALETLQYGLARDTELAGCLVHGHEAVPSSLAESGDEVIGQANAPGCAGRQLLARNDAVVEPAVQSRRGDAEHDRGLLDRRQFALGGGRPGLEARDVPVATQIADTARLEAMAVYRGAPLALEDAGNHGVWIMDGQPADECDRVLIGAYRGRPRARQREIDLVERAALPAQREVGCSLVALDLYDDLLEQCSQQLFPVTRRGRCRVPDGGKIGPEREQTVALLLGEHAWTLQFATCKLGLGGFECAQALLPLSLQAASDQPVVWIDGTVAALGAARFVACPLDAETPLLERGLAICFEPLGSGERGSELCRLEGGDEGPPDRLVHPNCPTLEAIDRTGLDQDLARAMIPRGGTAAAIVRVQAASAVPAAGKALQQGAAFPHGAAHFVRSGAGVLGDAILVGLIGLPIDEPRMMVRDEYLPLGARQLSHALCACTRCIQHRLLA